MTNILQKLMEKQDLTCEEAESIMTRIMSGSESQTRIAALLTSLKMKGETKTEIAAFASVMRKNAIRIKPNVGNLVDTCGTGGDSSNTFNISTTAALIAAGAGIKIAKHGNRSVSSKCGSADVLEKLGVKMLEPKKVEKCIEKIGIGFMFAPYFHPAMKYVAPVRKELGVRTVFNILGPLTNPASAHAQVLGVFDRTLIKTMAEALVELGTKKAMVVHSDGTDEIGLEKTNVAEINDGSIEEYIIDANEFGFKKTEMLIVDSKEKSAETILEILKGKTSPARDIAVLNAAAAIYVSGMGSFEDGITKATDSIDSGKAMEKLNELMKFDGEENELA
ncbi:MAG: anthranilate phosphoribosyltransferase [Candidatus Micrarchaeota archaeon]